MIASILCSVFVSRQASSSLSNSNLRSTPLTVVKIERTFVYKPDDEWLYSHHPHIATLEGKLIAIWSNGHSKEDHPGQRVLVSSSSDFTHWSKPAVLAAPFPSSNVLTAGGLFVRGGQVVAYFSSYDKNHQNTQLFAKVSSDGVTWGPEVDMQIPITPNQEPRLTHSGRLLMTGNFSFPYTDDPMGLSRWTFSSIAPMSDGILQDNPKTFSFVSTQLALPVQVCEGSFFQTSDDKLHMILRSTGPGWKGKLWETDSSDDGVTWTHPEQTEFSDNDSKFNFGELPDGKYFYVGNPDKDPRGFRNRLIFSTSSDGALFGEHFLVAQSPYKPKLVASDKIGQYGYPDTIIDGASVIIIVSRMKEAIEIMRFPLAELSNGAPAAATAAQAGKYSPKTRFFAPNREIRSIQTRLALGGSHEPGSKLGLTRVLW
jgi:hypothetical protein